MIKQLIILYKTFTKTIQASVHYRLGPSRRRFVAGPLRLSQSPQAGSSSASPRGCAQPSDASTRDSQDQQQAEQRRIAGPCHGHSDHRPKRKTIWKSAVTVREVQSLDLLYVTLTVEAQQLGSWGSWDPFFNVLFSPPGSSSFCREKLCLVPTVQMPRETQSLIHR